MSSNSPFTALGNTGGETTHKLTIYEIPSHSHSYNSPVAVWGSSGTNNGFAQVGGNWTGSDTAGGNYNHTANTGGNQVHNNMPPYIVVNYEVVAL